MTRPILHFVQPMSPMCTFLHSVGIVHKHLQTVVSQLPILPPLPCLCFSHYAKPLLFPPFFLHTFCRHALASAICECVE